MTDRGLITLAILLLLAIACALIATFVPRTRRVFWIAGLSFALVVFAGWTIMPIVALVIHRHLNSKGVLILFCNAYVARILFTYLLEKIREPKIASSIAPSMQST